MFYDAYLENIVKKTGKTPVQIRVEAINQEVLNEDIRATVFN